MHSYGINLAEESLHFDNRYFTPCTVNIGVRRMRGYCKPETNEARNSADFLFIKKVKICFPKNVIIMKLDKQNTGILVS